MICARLDELQMRARIPGLACPKLKGAGLAVTQVQLQGDRGHLDGVLSITQAEKQMRAFLAKLAPA